MFVVDLQQELAMADKHIETLAFFLYLDQEDGQLLLSSKVLSMLLHISHPVLDNYITVTLLPALPEADWDLYIRALPCCSDKAQNRKLKAYFFGLTLAGVGFVLAMLQPPLNKALPLMSQIAHAFRMRASTKEH